MVDPRAPSAGTLSGIRLRRSKIKSKTFIRRPRASLAERSVGPGRVHTDERRLSAVARIEPTDPTRSGRPDDGLREIGDRLSSSQAALGFTSFNSGRKTLFSSSLPGLTRQSMRPPRTCGEAAWATGSSPVATSGKTYESCRCKQTRGWSGQAGGCPPMTAMSVSSSSPD